VHTRSGVYEAGINSNITQACPRPQEGSSLGGRASEGVASAASPTGPDTIFNSIPFPPLPESYHTDIAQERLTGKPFSDPLPSPGRSL
jgi:hypothetical protein